MSFIKIYVLLQVVLGNNPGMWLAKSVFFVQILLEQHHIRVLRTIQSVGKPIDLLAVLLLVTLLLHFFFEVSWFTFDHENPFLLILFNQRAIRYFQGVMKSGSFLECFDFVLNGISFQRHSHRFIFNQTPSLINAHINFRVL